MESTTTSQRYDYRVSQKKSNVVPRPMSLHPNSPNTVIILTPDSNDPMFADIWQFSFDKLAEKFQALGIRALATPWFTAPLSCDSSQSPIYTVNLAWGYHQCADQWLAWLRRWPEEIKLINSSSLLLWNTRKTYLKDLQTAGIPTISTLYVDHIDEKTLTDAAIHFATPDLIIKPQVSACSFNMIRVLVDNPDVTFAPKSMSVSTAIVELERLGITNSPLMIQPFMTSVVEEGETSIFVFNGQIGHAVRNNTQPDDYRVQFEHGGVTIPLKEISNEILELVRATISACPENPIYARIDMIRNTSTGRLCIIEVELIEPNLYLEYAPDEGMNFVRAILQAGNVINHLSTNEGNRENTAHST